MFKILIVDDEKIERDGIKLLIRMNEFPLEVVEAENGEIALEYLRINPVNILFTDIKMPFMDGLQLADMAKKIYPHIKVIIFSAYGEFDYAQKAIKTNVMNYVLKPIDVVEFKQMMENVLRVCAEEEKEEEKTKEIIEGYLKGREYEKKKLLFDIISSSKIDNKTMEKINYLGANIGGKDIVLMLCDMKEWFFSSNNDEFVELLKTLLKTGYEYLNINENQSLLFLEFGDKIQERNHLEALGRLVQDTILEKYGLKSCIIFSDVAHSLESIRSEYGKIEDALDMKIFYDDGIIIFSSDTGFRKPVSSTAISRILKDITSAIDANDFVYALEGVRRLFELFKTSNSLSSIYVKFTCAEIMKKVYEKLYKSDSIDFMSKLEKIFKNDNMVELKDEIFRILSTVDIVDAGSKEESGKAVMRKVTDIIENEYMNDISLEYIAEKVYLTPTYLSYLFKKQSGHSLIKYITLYRLNTAKKLLKNSNMKIVDIGEKIGYANLSYFCMIFKNNFGVSPAKFREESGIE